MKQSEKHAEHNARSPTPLSLPKAVDAVAYRGHMVRREGERYAAYQPENYEWRDVLCDRDGNGRLTGKDPMALPLDVLSASGHPQATV